MAAATSRPARLTIRRVWILVDGEAQFSEASSVRRVHAVLHNDCHDAVRRGWLSVNPVAAADPPKQSGEHRDRSPGNRA
jgi:hypothetical protein